MEIAIARYILAENLYYENWRDEIYNGPLLLG